jgi:tetratricopeptide (TPR) repeat protein
MPTSNLIIPIGTVQADRLLYLPLLGLLLIPVAAFLRIPHQLTRGRLGLALLILLVLRLGVASAFRSTEWKDDRTLFEAAVRDAPRSLKARANLAAVLLRTESAAAAREALLLTEPVREIGEQFGPLIQREAKARMFLGEHGRARQLYRESLEKGADSAEVLIELGNLALMADDGAEALAAFRAAERTGERSLHVAIGRASALSLLGRYGESAAVWQTIVRALPDSVPVRTAAAWNLREAGRPIEAESLIREGLRRGEDARLWDSLARTLLPDGESGEEALRAARRAVSLSPTEPHLTTLALALLRIGRADEAMQTRRRVSDPELIEEIDEALRRP